MPLPHFHLSKFSTALWLPFSDLFYIGENNDHFTFGEKYTIFHNTKDFVRFSGSGDVYVDIKNFVSEKQFLRLEKLKKLNGI